jgi:hypothetical protein
MSPIYRIRRTLSFGGRLPPEIGALIVAIFVLSLTAAVGQRSGFPLFAWMALQPEAVWRGEVWRLATWVLFESDPLSLVFAGLLLYWFGRDLAASWGPRRFLRIGGGLTLLVAAVVCGAARLLWPELMGHSYLGCWTLGAALMIAWAVTFPERQLLLYFVLRVSGRQLLYLELGLTALSAIYYGLASVFHIITAQALMLLYLYRFSVRRQVRSLAGRWRRRRAAPNLRVWDEKKGDFRPPKWVN